MQQKICCSLAGDEPARNANVVVIRNGLIGQSTFKNVKIIAHPYTHNFPIFKHPAGVEPAPPIWKTGVISVRPRMHIYQHRHTGSHHTDGLCLKIRIPI